MMATALVGVAQFAGKLSHILKSCGIHFQSGHISGLQFWFQSECVWKATDWCSLPHPLLSVLSLLSKINNHVLNEDLPELWLLQHLKRGIWIRGRERGLHKQKIVVEGLEMWLEPGITVSFTYSQCNSQERWAERLLGHEQCFSL